MPVDLDDMFDTFRTDADALPLSPPRQVRRLGRRLRLIRVTTTMAVTCTAIVVAVAVATSWGQQHLAPSAGDPPGTGARLTFSAHPGGINAVAYSQDGGLLATAGNDGTVRLWDARTGKPTRTLTASAGPTAIQVAFGPDGTTLAASDAGGSIRLWDVATAQLIRTLAAPGSGPVTDIAFSPDGATLVAAAEDGRVRLWPTTGGQPSTITAPNVRVIQLALSPDGRFVVTGGQRVNQDGRQNTIGIWDTTTLTSAQTFAAFTGPLLSVAFSPDGQTFATGGDDGRARLWQKGTATPTAELVVSKGRDWNGVSDLAFSPDGRWLATGGTDRVKLWDVTTGALAATYAGSEEKGLSSVAFSPDGRTLAGAGGDGKVRLWDVP